VEPADLELRRMNLVDHELEVDGLVIRPEPRCYRIRRRIAAWRQAARDIRVVRVVAGRAELRVLGAIAAVEGEHVMAGVAARELDDLAPRRRGSVSNREDQ